MKVVTVLLVLILVSGLAASASLAFGAIDISDVFPDVDGIPKVEKPVTYAPENLYKYINGAAEVYLGYGFQELATQIYENRSGQSLTIEVYRHSDPRNGFGIYALERPIVGDFLKIGAQGYYEEGILNFVRGNYYVKLNSFNLGDDERTVLTGVAQDISDRLEGELEFPEIVRRFPKRGKVDNSERFVPVDFLGYSFLGNAYTCDYTVTKNKFKLFAIEGSDSAACEETLKKYMSHLGHPDVAPGEGLHTVEDPHHGAIGLLWKGKHIWGVMGLESPGLRAEYLELIERGLHCKK